MKPDKTTPDNWDWPQIFDVMLDRYRRDDGSRWNGRALERATSGYVSYRYISQVRTGRLSNPSYAKIYAISRAIGASVEEWAIVASSVRESDAVN